MILSFFFVFNSCVPLEFGVLMDALYQRAEHLTQRQNLGVSQGMRFDDVVDKYGTNAGLSLDTRGYIEEIAAKELEKIFGSAREFNKWYAEISGNEDVRTAFEKFMDFVIDAIEKIKKALKTATMTKEQRAAYRQTLAELERIKELYANALKVAENVVTERRQEIQTTETQKNTDTKVGVNYSLSKTKIMRLTQIIEDIGKLGIKKLAGNKKITILTDDFSIDKAIHSKKGRTDKEVNARIKAIPEFSSIIRRSEYFYTDTNIVGLNSKAKKGVVAMHYFKTVHNGFDIEVVVRDKGKKQFLYEVKFIENKKSSQQSMPTKVDSPAPKGDVENKNKLSQKPKTVKNDFSLKDSDTNQNLESKASEEYTSNVSYSLKNKRSSKGKRTYYDEYQTNAMIWARSSSTNAGDFKILSRNGKDFVVIEATDDGFIELSSGKYEEVVAIYERLHREKDTSFYEDAQEIRTEQNRDLWDLQYVENGGYIAENGGQIRREGLQTDTARNDKHMWNGVEGESADLVKNKNNSLKGGVSATELFDTVDDARKGKKKAVNKLAEFVESGAMSTELYDALIGEYGTIPSGEKPHRNVQVPRKTSQDKKVSQTVRTILEAKATPDEAVPTIEKLVEDGQSPIWAI